MRVGERGLGTRVLVGMIVAIVVATVVIYLLMPSGWKEYLGGPRVNLQSLGSGQFMAILEQSGLSASYGYYYQGSRVGGLTATSAGIVSYQGAQCYKIEGNFDMGLNISGVNMNASGSMLGYYEMDGLPKYFSYIFNYASPMQTTASAECTWDRTQSKMTTTVSFLGQTMSTVASLPSDYWEPISPIYVGYSKQFAYTIDNISASMTISVTGREDVTVPKGTYENCYVISIAYPNAGVNMTLWVDDEGVAPQAEVSMALPGTGTTTLTMKLEHYGVAP